MTTTGLRRLGGVLAFGLAAGCLWAWWQQVLHGGGLSLVRASFDQLRLPPHEQVVTRAQFLWVVPAHLLIAAGFYGWGLRGQSRLLRWTPRWFAAGLFAVAFIFVGVVRFLVLADAPVTDDEWAYVFQARTFAGGGLWALPPPDPDHFNYLFLRVHEGRWFCYQQPGLGVWLAIGEALTGHAFVSLWVANAALVPLCYGLGRRLFDETVARVGAVLLLLSPWYLLLAGTIEPYMPLGLLVVLWVWLTARLLATPGASRGQQAVPGTSKRLSGGSWRDALALGAVMGVMLLFRGLEFAIFGAAVAIAMVWRWAGQRVPAAQLAVEVGMFLVGLMPWLGWQLYYNHTLTGSAWVFPVTLSGAERFYGFGEGIYNEHTVLKGLTLWGTNLLRGGASWLIGSPLAIVALGLAVRRGVHRRVAAGVAGLCVFFVLLWTPYSMAGVADMGPVYLFATTPLLLLLVAVGVTNASTETGLARLRAGLVAAFVVSALAFLPLASVQLGMIARNVRAPYDQLIDEAGDQKALVLIRRSYPAPTGWVFGIEPPDPWLTQPVIFAHATAGDQSPGSLQAARAALPGHEPRWFVMKYGGSPRAGP